MSNCRLLLALIDLMIIFNNTLRIKTSVSKHWWGSSDI